jgi:hypothetical protein
MGKAEFMLRHYIAVIAAGLSGLGAAAWSPGVHAQEAEALPYYLAPHSKAFEVQLSTGYTQGFGNLARGVSIGDVAGGGLGLTLAVGYRASPRFSAEVEGQYQQYSPETSDTANGFNVNVGATFHASPESRGDPWLRLATGWRAIAQHTPAGPVGFALSTSETFHGWQVLSVRFGYDFRTWNNMAWAPFVGADLQAFFWDNGNPSTAQIGTFVYAGLQGRFDTGGTSSRTRKTALAAP